MKVLSVEQMRTVDKKAVKEYCIPGLLLMENAGRESALRVRAIAENLGISQIAVVCGKGSNGGDGFVCARYLERAGLKVKLFLIGRRRDVKGDAKSNILSLPRSIPFTEISASGLPKLKKEFSSAGLIVDAILGTGAKGPVRSPLSDVIDMICDSNTPVVSLDIPSGLDGDSGAAAETCVKSMETVTMGFYKLGLLLGSGPGHAGRVSVADIGIPAELEDSTEPKALIISQESAARLLPPRPADAHKSSCGKVFILAGSVGYSGAAILSSRAAMRSGCGICCLGAPRSLNQVLESSLPEVITRPLPETEAMTIGLEAEEQISAVMERSDVLAMGPGLGSHPETAALVRKLILTSNKPMVIDADALNSIGGEVSMLGDRRAPAVLTPHPGELSRLTGKTVHEILSDPLSVIRDISFKQKVVVVLKLHRTLISCPDASVFINTTGNPGMASAGTGDVLTGMIASFLSRKMSPEDAAKLGVFLHGLSGDIAAGELGEEALIAGDLIEYLPRAFKKITGRPAHVKW